MRIGIDLSCWANERGYGRYVRELVPTMIGSAPTDEFVGYIDAPSRDLFEFEAPNLEIVEVPQRAPPTVAASTDGSRSPIDMLRFTQAVWRTAPSVFFSPSVYTYFPLPPRQRAVVAVHDAIAERFPHLTLPSRRARWFWNAKVRLALWQCRLVITVSEFAADELEAVLRIPRSRIRVTLEAPAPAYRPSEGAQDIAAAAGRAGLPQGAKWFVYVGGFNPHKNVDGIVRAYAAAVAELPDPAPYLLLVGSTSRNVFFGNTKAIRAVVAEYNLEAQVLWTGFVPDDELRHLLSGAIALVMFSESEGFGLPAIEAAACGTPVIAPTASPLPQLLAGGGVFVEPRDLSALQTGMTMLATAPDRRQALASAALAGARRLSWRASAARALDALREAAA